MPAHCRRRREHVSEALRSLAAAARRDLPSDSRRRVDGLARTHAVNPEVIATLNGAPDRLERFLAFYEPLAERAFGDRRLREVLHRRVAELDGLGRTYALPADVSDLEPPSGLAPDEAALVAFVDALAVNHLEVPPTRFHALRRFFSDSQMMELLWAAAVARSLARVAAVLGVPYAV